MKIETFYKRKITACLATATALIFCTQASFAVPNQQESGENKSVDDSHGQELQGKTLNGKSLDEQYGGIVMDRTLTVAGQDFYQYFVALWSEKPFHEQFILSVREIPSARWGNQIFVEYGSRRVFEAVLPPNRSYIKTISEKAVEIAYQNVVDADVQRLFFHDEDIGADEM